MIGLAACTPRKPARVDEVGTKPHRTQTQSNSRHPIRDSKKTTHRVEKGDSLYSIGFRYQVDYKELAAINNIQAPYRIYPNQILKLKGDPEKIVFKPTSNKQVKTKPLVKNTPITAKSESQSKATPANKQTAKQSTPTSKPPTPTASNTSKPPAKKPVVVATPTHTNLQWLWPTQGKIRTTFLASNPARKGISIGGKEGQPVKASEAGVVVYSGNGLLGYGELIIIKHNESYLSAYGHNKSLKVKEGQTVTRGQVIAELGSTGTNVNNLHFEIRKNGTPVNPLSYVKP
ncbi:peptidoglycan DD-metalloendopeptidase family protein [Marinicella litoralis]|uniref:Murein DD-endopeptidase MepM/ murein hydrolase activator NlpD n=1 Tax=Marinicella litoralis TaxID=644220 RepID=A0A4R6XWB7_9GAMM|nr:peptidoglycan DD-metalloendopeptidase family protein [Marinicella litoralis]TDR22534.1 murein DD-endopeptidase MepM/ murein hydrolase activator NlpD [Marinicella litoralis]